jgi:hypothetical protein
VLSQSRSGRKTDEVEALSIARGFFDFVRYSVLGQAEIRLRLLRYFEVHDLPKSKWCCNFVQAVYASTSATSTRNGWSSTRSQRSRSRSDEA